MLEKSSCRSQLLVIALFLSGCTMVNVKRYRKARVFKSCCAGIIKTVIEKCTQEKSTGRLSINYGLKRAMSRVTNYTDISLHSLRRIKNADEQQIPNSSYSETRSHAMHIPEEDIAIIRPTILAMILERKNVNIATLHNRIKQDNPIWSWSRSSLYRTLMKRLDITFRLKVDRRYDLMREDPVNALRCEKYIELFIHYFENDRRFIYMNES